MVVVSGPWAGRHLRPLPKEFCLESGVFSGTLGFPAVYYAVTTQSEPRSQQIPSLLPHQPREDQDFPELLGFPKERGPSSCTPELSFLIPSV